MKDNKYTLPIGAKLQSPKRTYTIEQVLGQGGFGITYKVSAQIRVDNVIIRTFFAVKEFFMKESCERDSHDSVCYSSPVKDKVEESKKDFLAEAQRLNKISLEHPNLIHVNEVFEANNTVYYVMEYLDGGSLRSYVRKHGPLSEHEALEMMKPIFKAVDFLHQNRMTHLDIKPDNIMLKRDADSGKIIPVLIDFGLSKHYDKNGKPTSSIRILGCSDGYAPMEQYVGINTFTPQADVYALAATLLFSLTGKDPVIATELNKDKIVTSLPESVCSKVKEAIVSAMKMRKEERTQEVCSLLNSLDVQQEKATHSESVRQKENKIKTKKITAHHNRKTKKSFIVKTGIVLVTLLCFIFLTFNEIDNIKNTTNKPQLLANEKKDGVAKTQIPKAVDLGLSVMWADRNVEVKSLEHTGDFFKWGGVRPYLEDGENTVGKIYNISNTKYDVAHVCLGGKWRLPTKKEFEELLSKCSYKLDDSKDGGVSFISKSNGNKIFFPSTELDPEKGYRGYYWTGTGYNSEQSWGFIFGKETGETWTKIDLLEHTLWRVKVRPVMDY